LSLRDGNNLSTGCVALAIFAGRRFGAFSAPGARRGFARLHAGRLLDCVLDAREQNVPFRSITFP
jgi:hypothetical protein